MKYDRTVIAYHGCNHNTAERILAGDPFKPSENNYDWLGSGIYFWEFGHDRALRFEKGKARKPAVVGAIIQLGNCFDLMDTKFTADLPRAYQAFKKSLPKGAPLPKNSGTTPDKSSSDRRAPVCAGSATVPLATTAAAPKTTPILVARPLACLSSCLVYLHGVRADAAPGGSMRSLYVKGFVALATCAAAGCGGSVGGDTCGPGTSLAGNVCVVAPADATGSGEVTAEGGPAQVSPDGPASDTMQVDATAPLDGGPNTDTGALDAQADDGTGADAPGVVDADAASGDVAPFDSPNDSVGADVADATDGADVAVDAANVTDAADAAEASDAADAGRDVFGPPPVCPGEGGVPPATFVPLEGGLREILIDPCNAHVYVTNQSANRVEDYSVAAAALEAPIAVGSCPDGVDITPDGQRLYVANSGGANVSVVDLAARQELRKISFTSNFSGDTPLSLAIAANGTAFFSTTFAGSGFGGRMMSFDLASEAITQRTDFYINGTTTEATILKASADRSVIGIVAGDISSAPVFSYRSATDTFSHEHDLNGFIERVTVSADGSLLLVDGSQVLDPTPNLLGTIQGAATVYAAFGPSAAVAYRASTSGIDILDTQHFLAQSTIGVTADTIQGTGSYGPSATGNLAVSSDGKWIALITDHGIAIVDVP